MDLDPALLYGSGSALLRVLWLLYLDATFYWLIATVKSLDQSGLMLNWIRIALCHMDLDQQYYVSHNYCTWILHSPGCWQLWSPCPPSRFPRCNYIIRIRIRVGPDITFLGYPAFTFAGYPDIRHLYYTCNPDIRHSHSTGFPDIQHWYYTGYPYIQHSYYTGYPDILHSYYTGYPVNRYSYYTDYPVNRHSYYTGYSDIRNS